MGVISLRKSFTELDAIELRDVIRDTLTKSIEAAADYAPEVNHLESEDVRSHLRHLAAQVQSLSQPEDFRTLQVSFRGELRECRDRIHQNIQQLRQEIANAVEAMSNVMNGVTTSGDQLETGVKKEFTSLEARAQNAEPDEIRAAIAQSATAAVKLCQDAKRANQVTIAQLQDEIRALHREVERERRSVQTDRETALWNREKVHARIKDLMLLDEAFCVFMVGICNLSHHAQEFQPQMIQECVKVVGGRLKTLVGQDAMIGRWSLDTLTIIFNMPKTAVPVPAEIMESRLTGSYAVQDEGNAYQVDLDVHVTTVERPKGVSEAAFYPRLGQASFAAIHREMF